MKDILKLAELGKKMRLSQQEYFRTKASISFKEAEKIEKEFDKVISELIDPMPEKVPDNQTRLL